MMSGAKDLQVSEEIFLEFFRLSHCHYKGRLLVEQMLVSYDKVRQCALIAKCYSELR